MKEYEEKPLVAETRLCHFVGVASLKWKIESKTMFPFCGIQKIQLELTKLYVSRTQLSMEIQKSEHHVDKDAEENTFGL